MHGEVLCVVWRIKRGWMDGWMDDAWREKEDYGMKHE